MQSYASGVKGQVRVLATASALAEQLAEDLAVFLKNPDYRNIQVDIEERLSVDVVRGIKEGVASVGICWDVADFQGLVTRPYRTRSEEHTSELQSLMRISYAVFCLKKKT